MSNCEHTKQSWLIAGAVLLLVALDQALKLYIRTHFALGEAHEILPFFQLCLVHSALISDGFSNLVCIMFDALQSIQCLFHIAKILVYGCKDNK